MSCTAPLAAVRRPTFLRRPQHKRAIPALEDRVTAQDGSRETRPVIRNNWITTAYTAQSGYGIMHRAGWKLFWRLKSRPDRQPIPQQLQVLIRRMATENPSWGEERIANELPLKLGIQVSPRTVRKYSPYRPPGRPRRDLRWSTFLRLQAHGIIPCDATPPRSSCPSSPTVIGR